MGLIVIGASGFLGRHVSDQASRAGHQVTVAANLSGSSLRDRWDWAGAEEAG